MTAVGLTACVAVVAWLLATLVYQYSPVQVAVDRHDPFKVLPSWAFFAPNPAYHDYHLLVRELRRDGSFGPCVAIGKYAERRLTHAIWNPAKRPQRVLLDAMQAIKRFRRWSASEDVLQCSLPYLLLLHHAILHYQRGADAAALQFVVAETSGRDGKRIWIAFVSGFHRLSPPSVRTNSSGV